MSPRRSSRRQFLSQVPAVVATGLAAPAIANAQGQAQPITTQALGAAQEISGLRLPEAERESAQPIVTRNRDNYELLRKVEVPSETEPAFSFRPPRPRAAGPTRNDAPRRQARTSQAPRVPRPATLEQLAFAPVSTLAALLRARQVSSVELTRMYLDRLKRHDATLMCVVTLTEELALTQAEQADKEMAAGKYRGPLHGVPYGIKDLFATRGILTTWGAQPYSTQVFDYDATVVERLRNAGAVLVAKLSTGELAIGDLWFRGRTRNPWSPERGSSGSSAGPASAASAGLVGFAIGTETGGSIMSPASTCGVVGLRPTYGRISRHGCMTLRWTLDKVGPITRSVVDASVVLDALHGPDGHDETVPDIPFAWDGRSDVKGLRIGYVAAEFDAPPANASDEERARWLARKPLYDAAFEVYRRAGASLVPVTLPDLPAGAIYAVLNAEAGAMFDELVRSGRVNELSDKGPNGRANQLRASRFIPAVDYIRAQRVRTLLVQRYEAMFRDVDVFLDKPGSDSVTATNLTGHPALVVPAGFAEQLPVGLMITGRYWDEATVLRAGAAFESATEWHTKQPPLYASLA